eukprot:g71289.t1
MVDGLDVLKVKFTHFNTVREKKPYTIYEIEVRSSSTITWVIYKRYSDFYTLHQKLQKAYEQNKTDGSAIRLPQLPPKRLTRSLAPEFVEKRKEELQEYLCAVLASPVLLHSPILLHFLEVPDSVRPMLSRASGGSHQMLRATAGKDKRDGAPDPKTFEERKVSELIRLLQVSPNKVAAIEAFEEYFFEHKPRLSHEYIQRLFQGLSGREGQEYGNVKGLIQTCGDFEYSHVASRAALNLLCRLLDVEKNKDAQLFLDVFTALDPAVLKRMHLHMHIISKRSNRLGAFRIVQILTSAGGARSAELTVDHIIGDPYARQEYHRWAERKTAQVAPFGAGGAVSDQVQVPSLSKSGHKLIVQQGLEEIIQLANNQSGWRKVSALDALTSSPTATDSPLLEYVKDTAKDMVAIKITTVLRFKSDHVAAFLNKCEKRRDWDLKFHHGTQLQKIDSTNDIVHLVFKTFSSPYKHRDFVLLRSITKLQNGMGWVILARSITHPAAPEVKSNVRAVLSPSGYILTPLPKAAPLPLCPQGAHCAVTEEAHRDRFAHHPSLQVTNNSPPSRGDSSIPATRSTAR